MTWLVRTSKNMILGPFNKEDLCQKITKGEFSTLDEVCKSDGYWFFLNEAKEVQAHLGITPPKPQFDVDEITHTEKEFTKTSDLTPLQLSIQNNLPTHSKESTRPLNQLLNKIENASILKAITVLLIAFGVALFLSVLRLVKI